MKELKCKASFLDAQESSFPTTVVSTNTNYVGTSVFDALYQRAFDRVKCHTSTLWWGELEEYVLLPLIKQINAIAVTTDYKNLDTGTTLIVRSLSFALIAEYLQFSVSKDVARQMTKDMVENNPIYTAMQDVFDPGKSNVDVMLKLEQWLAVNPSTSAADRMEGAPYSFDHFKASAIPVLAVAERYLNPGSNVAEMDAALSTSLGDCYDSLFANMSKGKGYRSKEAKRKESIASFNQILTIAKQLWTAGSEDMASKASEAALTILYWFNWYLDAAEKPTPEFMPTRTVAQPMALTAALATKAKKLSAIFAKFTMVPVTFQGALIIAENEDCQRFYDGFIPNTNLLMEVREQYQKAKATLEAYFVPSIKTLVDSARANYASMFPGRNPISPLLLKNWADISKPITSVKDLFKDERASLVSKLSRDTREQALVTMAYAASGLWATAQFVAQHVDTLKLGRPDAGYDVQDITGCTIFPSNYTGDTPQFWQFQNPGSVAIVMDKWIDSKTADMKKLSPVQPYCYGEELQPFLKSQYMAKVRMSSMGPNPLVFWHSLAGVPIADALAAPYFSQPVPFQYTKHASRMRKSYSMSSYLQMMQHDTYAYSEEDFMYHAAQFVAEASRAEAYSIANAMSACGLWYIKANGLSKQDILDQHGGKADHSTISEVNIDGDTWYLVQPTFPAIWGIPTDAFCAANTPYTLTADKPGASTFIYTAEVTTLSGDQRQVAFHLHYAYPGLTSTRYLHWISSNLVALSIPVNSSDWEKVYGEEVAAAISTGSYIKIDDVVTKIRALALTGPNSSTVGFRTKKEKYNGKDNYVDFLEKLIGGATMTDSKCTWTFPRYFHNECLVLPQISYDLPVLNEGVIKSILASLTTKRKMRLNPSTHDLEMQTFYDDQVYIIDKQDFEAILASADPSILPAAVGEVGNADDRPTDDVPTNIVPDANIQSPTASAGVTALSKEEKRGYTMPAAQANANDTVTVTPNVLSMKDGDGNTVPINTGNLDERGLLGNRPTKKDDTKPTPSTDKAAFSMNDRGQAVIDYDVKALNTHPGHDGVSEVKLPHASEPMPQAINDPHRGNAPSPQAEVLPGAGDPAKEGKPNNSGIKEGGAASGSDIKTKFYKKVVDGKIVDIIEVADGETVPEGYVPASPEDKKQE